MLGLHDPKNTIVRPKNPTMVARQLTRENALDLADWVGARLTTIVDVMWQERRDVPEPVLWIWKEDKREITMGRVHVGYWVVISREFPDGFKIADDKHFQTEYVVEVKDTV